MSGPDSGTFVSVPNLKSRSEGEEGSVTSVALLVCCGMGVGLLCGAEYVPARGLF
jgi:hypothetical protein